MKTTFKRSSLVMLVVLTILSLTMSIAPVAVSAQEECPTNESIGCSLLVNIVAPASNAEILLGDTFWVNATVAKPLNISEIEGVDATITVGPGAMVLESLDTEPVTLDNCTTVTDFWWKVKCIAPGLTTITVDATSTTAVPETCVIGGTFAGSDSVTVKQVFRPCDPKLVITIIECPETAIPNGPTFGVKALVQNVSDSVIENIWATISWLPAGAAGIIGSPNPIYIHSLNPGTNQEVGWTLQCLNGQDVKFTINATFSRFGGQDVYDEHHNNINRPCEVLPGICAVDQICPAAGKITVSGVPDKICVECEDEFVATATITNTCDDTALNVLTATLTVTGDAVIKTPDGDVKVLHQAGATIPGTTPNSSITRSWNVECTGPLPAVLTFSVLAQDPNGQAVVIAPVTKTVKQIDALMVDFLSPANNTKVNNCQTYDVTYRVTNCSSIDTDTTIYAGLSLVGAPNVDIASASVHIQYCPFSGFSPTDVTAVEVSPGVWTVPLECLCGCCWADLTWHLVCTGSDFDVDSCELIAADSILAFAGLDPLDDPVANASDSDTLLIQQMYKAHLSGNLLAYEGTISGNNFESFETINSLAVGETFTVVGVVDNLGQATAQNVHAVLNFTGPAELLPTDQSLDVALGNIGCHGSAKAIWTLVCTGEGTVQLFLQSLSGTDANTHAAIPSDNIERGCPIYICQIPIAIKVIQPLTSTDFVVGDTFTVKAQICNNSVLPDETFCEKTLEDVTAVLRWERTAVLRGEEVEDEHNGCFGGMRLVVGQSNPITLPNPLKPGECAEVTWQVQCCWAVDVTFWIEVYTNGIPGEVYESPYLDISSTPETIHQHEPGGIACRILSPGLGDYDMCYEPGITPEAYVATGQEFAVTTKLFNTGDLPFTIQSINLNTFGDGEVAVVEGPLPAVPITLAKHESVIVSFTLVGTESGATWIEVKASGKDTNNGPDSCESGVLVMVYPAANLALSISGPTANVVSGTDFSVTVHVCNVGEADATSVSLTLSVQPAGSVRVSSADPVGSFTKPVGTLTGHTVNQCKDITWILHCDQVGMSTITVSASGQDEYGYQVKQICASELFSPGIQVTCCELLLDGTPLTAIRPEFIGSASLTVNQVSGGSTTTPPTTPPGDSVSVALEQGWNLISIPWYVEAAKQDPNVMFAGIKGSGPDYNMNVLYAFDAASMTWDIWTPTSDPPPATLIDDGKGYWINVDAAGSLVMTGALNPADPGTLPPSYPVVAGWNLVGFKNGTAGKSIDDYLYGLSFAIAYTYDNGGWVQVTHGQSLQPGFGYWVAFTAPGTIYP